MAAAAQAVVDLVAHLGRNRVPRCRCLAHGASVPNTQLMSVVAA
jgi:hypothetical protein